MKTQDEIILWGAGTSRTLRPIWVAEELGLEYTLNAIGPRTGETQSPEYTRLNPKQKIPFCEDGDIKLSESVAICRHLVRRYGKAESLQPPQTIEAMAKEEEWLCFIYGELDETSLYVMRRHGALANVYGESPQAMEAAEAYVVRMLKVFEKHLATNSYLVSESFSLPDLFLMTCLNWVDSYGITMPESLKDYQNRIAGRPAYLKAKSVNESVSI